MPTSSTSHNNEDIDYGTERVGVTCCSSRPLGHNNEDIDYGTETDHGPATLNTGCLVTTMKTSTTVLKEIEARLFVEGGDSLLAREVVSDQATVSVDVDELDVDEFGELSGSGSLNIETA